jgi:hypothetical protein
MCRRRQPERQTNTVRENLAIICCVCACLTGGISVNGHPSSTPSAAIGSSSSSKAAGIPTNSSVGVTGRPLSASEMMARPLSVKTLYSVAPVTTITTSMDSSPSVTVTAAPSSSTSSQQQLSFSVKSTSSSKVPLSPRHYPSHGLAPFGNPAQATMGAVSGYTQQQLPSTSPSIALRPPSVRALYSVAPPVSRIGSAPAPAPVAAVGATTPTTPHAITVVVATPTLPSPIVDVVMDGTLQRAPPAYFEPYGSTSPAASH